MPLALSWPVLMLHVTEKYLPGLLERSSGKFQFCRLFCILCSGSLQPLNNCTGPLTCCLSEHCFKMSTDC